MVSWQGCTCWSRCHHQPNKISGFWVISCNSLVRSVIGKCVRCKQLRGQLQQQKMADLLKERMCIEPTFTYCGIDIFWHFVVKDGPKEVKEYDALLKNMVLYVPSFQNGYTYSEDIKHRFVHLESKTFHRAKRNSKDDHVWQWNTFC